MKTYTKVLPSIDELNRIFIYDPQTGEITNRINRGRRVKAGQRAGCVCKNYGYHILRIDRMGYKAHRVAWAITHGAWPKNEIDHRNNIRNDNRMENLREATSGENMRNRSIHKNNKSGIKGVSWYPKTQKWRSFIALDRKLIALGYFATKEEAAAAYAEASRRLHGEFGRVA